MNVLHSLRVLFGAGILAGLLILGFFAPRAWSEDSPLSGTPPLPNLTPLDLNALGPHSAPVNFDKFEHIWYISLVSEGWARKSGEPAFPWSSLAEALEKINDAGPQNRYALIVAAGVYPVNRLAMKPFVEIYGGFDPATWNREVTLHPTFLEGGPDGPMFYGASDCCLDGFTLRNGRNSEPGGAIICRDASPRLSNCAFTTNRTKALSRGPASSVPGGAIACIGRRANPLIEKCIFAFNATSDGNGGAIACLDGASPRVDGCIFNGNISGIDNRPPDNTSNGGAIACVGGAGIDLDGNLFLDNLAADHSDGGALYLREGGHVRLRRNIFAGNNAGSFGGGIFALRQKDFFMSANVLASNYARDYGGGACFQPGCEGVIENALICRNKAGVGGGGLSINGDSLTISGATICNNFAEDGGGIRLVNTPHVRQMVRMFNSIVFFNDPLPEIFVEPEKAEISMTYSVIGEGWSGRGVLDDDPCLADDEYTGKAATMEFDPQTYQTHLILVGSDPIDPRLMPGRVITIGSKHSVITANRPRNRDNHQEVWVWGDMSGGGINAAPVIFSVMPTFRPVEGSPCIDAGVNRGPAEDLYGNPRPAKGSSGATNDIGAVEYIPPPARIAPEIISPPPEEGKIQDGGSHE